MNRYDHSLDSTNLFVFWQDPVTRRWHVVAQLTRRQGKYRFAYTKGAVASKNFIPFGRMSDLSQEYQSDNLLPLFSNRVLPRSRPEYLDYLKWLEIDEQNPDPLLLLARTGGLRGTDSLSVYPAPTRDENGEFHVVFFCHGVRYIAESALNRISGLQPNERLYPMHDMQNPHDDQALALRSADPATFLGYCPRFFASDFRVLLQNHPNEARVSVVRVNSDAPIELRLLCEFRSPWPEGFRPFEGDEYVLLKDDHLTSKAEASTRLRADSDKNA